MQCHQNYHKYHNSFLLVRKTINYLYIVKTIAVVSELRKNKKKLQYIIALRHQTVTINRIL